MSPKVPKTRGSLKNRILKGSSSRKQALTKARRAAGLRAKPPSVAKGKKIVKKANKMVKKANRKAKVHRKVGKASQLLRKLLKLQ